MRFAITGTDARFLPLRKLLLADGHEITDPASADMVISPPWDPSARYARREEYQIAIARLTAEGAIALLRPETGLSGAHILLLGYGRIARLLARELQKAGALVTAAAPPVSSAHGRRRRASRLCRSTRSPARSTGLMSSLARSPRRCSPSRCSRSSGRTRCCWSLPPRPAGSMPPRRTRGVFATSARRACRRNTRRSAPRSFCATRCHAAAAEPLPRLGLAVTGSHCTFSRALEAFRPLKRDYTLVPILSGAAAGTDTRFFRLRLPRGARGVLRPGSGGHDRQGRTARHRAAARCAARRAVHGQHARKKLARGVTDTAVTMACKAHLRNGAPLILAISTNDGLSGSAESIAALLQRKNVYFVPFRQDAPHQKPFSLQSDFDLLGETIKAAMEGRQLQPVLL